MTQEQKDLLLKDLCARILYKVKVQDTYYKSLEPASIWLLDLNAQKVRLFADEDWQRIEYIKPYLFPLSSMTEEERNEYKHFVAFSGNPTGLANFIDWLNAHHFDYRGLIEKGLAIDASFHNVY